MTANPRVLIIGYGNVGKNLYDNLTANSNLSIDVVDINNEDVTDYDKTIEYDLAFICVDTPKNKVYCDLTAVENCIKEYRAKIFVIKSTCLVGSFSSYSTKVVFSPEFFGVTNHCLKSFDYTILGGKKNLCGKVVQILQRFYNPSHKFFITDMKTAQLVKYMHNTFLAMKVVFCNEFAKICKKENICYEELRELFIANPQIESSHTFVYEDKPYYESHCFDKDIPALIDEYNLQGTFIDSIVKQNEKNKKSIGDNSEITPDNC